MTLDEFEAIRLADLEGLYQDEAAGRMGISRPTFARLVEAARRKVADTLVHGKALRIEGGPVAEGAHRCPRCATQLEPSPDCPQCAAEQAAASGEEPTGCRRRRGRRAPGQAANEE